MMINAETLKKNKNNQMLDADPYLCLKKCEQKILLK